MELKNENSLAQCRERKQVVKKQTTVVMTENNASEHGIFQITLLGVCI